MRSAGTFQITLGLLYLHRVVALDTKIFKGLKGWRKKAGYQPLMKMSSTQ